MTQPRPENINDNRANDDSSRYLITTYATPTSTKHTHLCKQQIGQRPTVFLNIHVCKRRHRIIFENLQTGLEQFRLPRIVIEVLLHVHGV